LKSSMVAIANTIRIDSIHATRENVSLKSMYFQFM
jgi:hypothetical protein